MASTARLDAFPVNGALRWIAGVYRVLVWVWMLILIGVVWAGNAPGSQPILAAAMVLATVWTGITVWAARRHQRLANPWFTLLDGIVALLLGGAGVIAGTNDFISGGWPGSWLFMVAYAFNLRWTVVGGLVLVGEHVLFHLLHGLPPVRTAGTFQFITLAVVIGWAFDNLRHRERLRLRTEAELAREREETARHEERARLALHLHDSVLQTLHAIQVNADEAAEIRYLSRRQERELRRTIEEFRSPYPDSFRATLLGHRDEVEDLCRGVKIIDVIRHDALVTPGLAIALTAAREAMMNAGKYSGAPQIDLYSEIADGEVVIHVRDRGDGFVVERPGHGLGMVVIEPVEAAGGKVLVTSRPGVGTEVTIRMPCP